jgi:hypothetical protein
MSKCSVCNNQLATVAVHYPGGPMGTRIKKMETYCPYCNWKGTSGPGKQLRDVIKEHNS